MDRSTASHHLHSENDVGTSALPSSSSSTAASSNDLKQNGVRRRAMSLAESQPSVETVIVKAKRAAQSLWMLLHAKNCVQGQKCPHTGCQEAKLLHLHLKTCRPTMTGECPMQYHGCDQSRKLLAHYRRCRGLRAARQQAKKSVGGRTGDSAAETHHCLVCSLVARHARTILFNGKTTYPTSFMKGTSSAKQSSNGSVVKRASSSASQKVSYAVSTGETSIDAPEHRRGSKVKMPPPPPRETLSDDDKDEDISLYSLSHLYQTAKQLDSDVVVPSPSPGRERTASDAEAIYHNKATTEHPEGRVRSASVGTVPSNRGASLGLLGSPIETIVEE